MKLYIAAAGAVYHLRPDCVKAADACMIEVTAKARKEFSEAFGIRRICLRCRKAARRAV